MTSPAPGWPRSRALGQSRRTGRAAQRAAGVAARPNFGTARPAVPPPRHERPRVQAPCRPARARHARARQVVALQVGSAALALAAHVDGDVLGCRRARRRGRRQGSLDQQHARVRRWQWPAPLSFSGCASCVADRILAKQAGARFRPGFQTRLLRPRPGRGALGLGRLGCRRLRRRRAGRAVGDQVHGQLERGVVRTSSCAVKRLRSTSRARAHPPGVHEGPTPRAGRARRARGRAGASPSGGQPARDPVVSKSPAPGPAPRRSGAAPPGAGARPRRRRRARPPRRRDLSGPSAKRMTRARDAGPALPRGRSSTARPGCRSRSGRVGDTAESRQHPADTAPARAATQGAPAPAPAASHRGSSTACACVAAVKSRARVSDHEQQRRCAQHHQPAGSPSTRSRRASANGIRLSTAGGIPHSPATARPAATSATTTLGPGGRRPSARLAATVPPSPSSRPRGFGLDGVTGIGRQGDQRTGRDALPGRRARAAASSRRRDEAGVRDVDSSRLRQPERVTPPAGRSPGGGAGGQRDASAAAVSRLGASPFGSVHQPMALPSNREMPRASAGSVAPRRPRGASQVRARAGQTAGAPSAEATDSSIGRQRQPRASNV